MTQCGITPVFRMMKMWEVSKSNSQMKNNAIRKERYGGNIITRSDTFLSQMDSISLCPTQTRGVIDN